MIDRIDNLEYNWSYFQSKQWSSILCESWYLNDWIIVETKIRLVNGAGPWEGRVEVNQNGKWGTICDSSFGVNEASVLCRMIGFHEA